MGKETRQTMQSVDKTIEYPVRGWNLSEAITFYQRIVEMFHGYGWLVTLYGSVLSKGAGRDLDLIAVPWRREADFWSVVNALLTAEYGCKIMDHGEGLMGTLSWALMLKDRHVIDVQFRPVSMLCPVCRSFQF